MKLVKIYAFLLCLAAFAQNAMAQANLSVQGTIQKSTGASVDDGEYSLTFKLYTTETGGTAVWSETQSDVDIVGGVYSVVLGTVTPLTAAFDQTYYLGITVGTNVELSPRSRLTASPYALSLIGQDNIFPSTGAVGAGTATPTAGNELHVKDGTADAKMTVEGATTSKIVVASTDGSEIEFKKGANTASITYDGTNIFIPNLYSSAPADPANFVVTSKLAVGQSAVDANYAFRVTGESQFANYVNIGGSYKYFNVGGWVRNAGSGSSAYNVGTGNYGFNLSVDGRIMSQEYWVVSDRRIKKDFRLSDKTYDLATLRNLKVTDYSHVDFLNKGNDFKKGFIAQEVREAFPEAVTISSEFVPNVYEVSTDTKLAAGQMTVSLDKKHDFAVGDEVKLILPDGERKMTVVAVPSATSFTVDWAGKPAAEQVFVYGKKVSDFHTVDYDRIFTLNVSATQELAREVEYFKKENAALRQQFEASQVKNEGLQKQNSELRSDLNGMNQRLLNLEKRGAANLEK